LAELAELLAKLLRHRDVRPTAQPRVALLVLQPTPFCNLACSYCYLPNRSDKSRMSIATVERTIGRLVDDDLIGAELSIVWHAGEPLTVPVAFYASACEAIDRVLPHGVVARYSLQTNATLVDDDWCRLFLERRFSIGVSLDGPDFLHDAYRVSRNGRGTHAAVMRGVRTLQRFGVPSHVIAVLTRRSLDFPDAIFDFFRAAGLNRVGFNVEEQEGSNVRSSLDDEDSAAAMKGFFARLLVRVVENRHELSVRELDQIFAALRSDDDAGERNEQAHPYRILSVDHAGRFSTFSPELLGTDHPAYGSFTFGDVHSSSFRTMGALDSFRRIETEIRAGVEACRRTCEYFPLCGGGAPSNKVFEKHSFGATETNFCRLGRKAIVDAVLDWAERGGVPVPSPVPC
jgi:uncharacterized protein